MKNRAPSALQQKIQENGANFFADLDALGEFYRKGADARTGLLPMTAATSQKSKAARSVPETSSPR